MGKIRFTYLLFGCLLLVSCNQVKLSDARRQFLNGEYYAASETYRKLYAKTSRDARAMRGVLSYEMGESYRKLNMTPRAVTAYANAVRYNYPDTLLFLRYAQMLHKNAQYTQAKKAYEDYLKLAPNDMLAKNGLEGIRPALLSPETPPRYVVKRMDIFNSNRGEFCPMLAQDDETLYFTSSRDEAEGDTLSDITGMKNNDVFTAQKNIKGEWQPPKKIQSVVNTVFDEGVVSLTRDGNLLFYTFSSENDKRPGTARICVSEKSGANWGAGEPVIISRRDTVSVFAHPAISPDGAVLYFVSDMPGGYGGKDLWRAELIGKTVVEIKNLGPEINTEGDEMFPVIRNDTMLYFSSDGHPGWGGLDIFKAIRLSKTGSWRVEAMPFPVNSSADDFGITFEKNNEKGFFSSNRNDARGRDHIYSFEYSGLNIRVEGVAKDKEGQPIDGATISVVGDNGFQQEFVTEKKGAYRFNASNGVNYVFVANATGFLNLKQTLHTLPAEKDTVYYVDFEMTPYNKPVILENIFYDFNRATLRPESKEELDGLINILQENPNISIELSAHTDRKGTDEYNQNLSLRRAQSVVHYLISQGISDKRLTAVGFGKTQPKTVTKNMTGKYDFLKEGDVLNEEFIGNLTPEQQEVADQINRRTEFRVTDSPFGLF